MSYSKKEPLLLCFAVECYGIYGRDFAHGALLLVLVLRIRFFVVVLLRGVLACCCYCCCCLMAEFCFFFICLGLFMCGLNSLVFLFVFWLLFFYHCFFSFGYCIVFFLLKFDCFTCLGVVDCL